MRWPKWFKVRLGDEIVEGMTAQARLASDLVDSLSYLAPYLHHCRPLPTILTCVTRLGRIRNSVTDVRPATRASLESTITGGCHHPYGASDHEGAARPLLALAKAQGSRAPECRRVANPGSPDRRLPSSYLLSGIGAQSRLRTAQGGRMHGLCTSLIDHLRRSEVLFGVIPFDLFWKLPQCFA